ncbi:MAG TPA: zf-HC2 domain-containing protein [Actinomycetota bacterium]|jgi:predicted anti-sigma-YlaC factor YlaD|nr:zf-HC2 domain-containing protein [Actinomycetota bacterium]
MTDRPEHIACVDFVRLVSDYLERRLTSEETSLVEEHLNFCDGCGRYLDQVRQTIHLAGLLREGNVDPKVRASLLEAFRKWRRV